MNYQEIEGGVKKTDIDPKVYGLMIKSTFGSMIYMGVHYSLEDAFLYAKRKMASSLGEDLSQRNVTLDMWTIQTAAEVLRPIFGVQGMRAEDVTPQKVTSANLPLSRIEDYHDDAEFEEVMLETMKPEERKSALMHVIKKEKNRLMKEFLSTKSVPSEKEIISLFSEEEMTMMKENVKGNKKKKE